MDRSPWRPHSPGQNTGVGSLSLLQGIFPTQGLNPGLPHCRQILYQLSHQGSLSPQKGLASSQGQRDWSMKGVDGREILGCWFWWQGEPRGKERERGLWEQRAAPADSQQGNGDLSPAAPEHWILLSAWKTLLIYGRQSGRTWILGRSLAENPVMPCTDIPSKELWAKEWTIQATALWGSSVEPQKSNTAAPHSASTCPPTQTQHVGHTHCPLSAPERILSPRCSHYA